MKKLKDCLYEEIAELHDSIEDLLEKYNKKVVDKFISRIDNFSDEEQKLLKNLNYLGLLSMIGDYEYSHVESIRELTALHNSITEPATKLEPSGKESACIKLWSGSKEYQEEYATEHKVVRAKFAFLRKD
jgi:hypothetical protein